MYLIQVACIPNKLIPGIPYNTFIISTQYLHLHSTNTMYNTSTSVSLRIQHNDIQLQQFSCFTTKIIETKCNIEHSCK